MQVLIFLDMPRGFLHGLISDTVMSVEYYHCKSFRYALIITNNAPGIFVTKHKGIATYLLILESR